MDTLGLDVHFKEPRCYLIRALDLDLKLISGLLRWRLCALHVKTSMRRGEEDILI